MAHRELELKSISQVEPRVSIRSQHRDESIWDWGLLYRDAIKVEIILNRDLVFYQAYLQARSWPAQLTLMVFDLW